MYHNVFFTGSVASKVQSTDDETFFAVRSVKTYKDRAGAIQSATAKIICHVPKVYGDLIEERLTPGARVSVRGTLMGNDLGGPYIRDDEKNGTWTCFDIRSFAVKVLGVLAEGQKQEDEFFLVIAGNLGRDPEMRYTPQGDAVTNFSIAVNTGHRNKETDEFVKETLWFRVAIWGRQAETAAKFLHKGSKCLIEGALLFDTDTGAPRLYDRNDGSVGASFEATAFSYKLLDKKGEGPEPEFQGDAGFAGADDGEEIPF